jgi:hypothetical protein
MNELWTCYVLLYYSEGCNFCGLVLRKCYINHWHTTTCSVMQGHHTPATKYMYVPLLYDFDATMKGG